MKTHLVLGGGGVYGIAMLGALSKMRTDFTHLSGSSAGALICTCLCVATPAQIFDRLQDRTLFPDSCVDFETFVTDFGFVDHSFILDAVGDILEEFAHVRDPTLSELFSVTRRHLWICGTDVRGMCPVYFGHKTHPHMPVSLALRISTSIPFVMKKVAFEGRLYTDGCISDSFPIAPFGDVDSSEVVGVRIHHALDIDEDSSLLEFAQAVALSAIHKSPICHPNVIDIEVDGVGALVEETGKQAIVDMFMKGRHCADLWLKKES